LISPLGDPIIKQYNNFGSGNDSQGTRLLTFLREKAFKKLQRQKPLKTGEEARTDLSFT
jgi:hypothetical protein